MKFQSLDQLLEQLVELIDQRVNPQHSAALCAFARRYYRRIELEAFEQVDLEDLYGVLLSHWNYAQQRLPGEIKVRVFNPSLESHDWQSSHTVIELVVDDRPFLLQSIIMELNRSSFTSHLVIHPTFSIHRNQTGERLTTPQSATSSGREALIHLEVDRQSDPEVLTALQQGIEEVVIKVTAAADDWQACRKQVGQALELLHSLPEVVSAEAVEDAQAFLSWLLEDHFIFLGFREYSFKQGDQCGYFQSLPGTGLGILRDALVDSPDDESLRLSHDACAIAQELSPLLITKATSRSVVQRPVFMDYIGVKRFDREGTLIGEMRFLGLYSSTAYRAPLSAIPLLQRKVGRLFQRSEFSPESHSGRALMHILEDLPRDELFHASEDELYQCAIGVMQLQQRQRVRLFLRQDVYGQFISALVFVPRERFNTELRQKLRAILMETLNGISSEFKVQLSESPLARIQFTIHTGACCIMSIDTPALEQKFVEALRLWRDGVSEALQIHLGEEHGNRIFNAFIDGISTAYQEDFTPRNAVVDLERIDALMTGSGLELMLYRPLELEQNALRFKLYCRSRTATLSDILPMLENMGVKVVDEKPYDFSHRNGRQFWMRDFGLAYETIESFDLERLRDNFEEAFEQVWLGRMESDGFNQLVLRADMAWPQVMVLRAFYFYLRQIGIAFSQRYVEQTLNSNPEIAAQLVALFDARFNPQKDNRQAECERLVETISEQIDQVASLDQDRILRRYLNLVQAIVRCNCYQQRLDPLEIPYYSFKLDPAKIDALPKPRPGFEIFVYSPRVEGVHLRGGAVARGGLRWSERREDFRTEILGLMKAQLAKNAVIIPTGAKGGFITKGLYDAMDASQKRQEVVEAYQIFIRGLLDLTDNLVDDAVVKPERVVCLDGDDPYLVVAADKGTATFSDIANNLAEQYGFWLGDAFASGGSVGYDHKKMAITARGAWESVKRHFVELAVDIQTTPFTVVGIGDMSGDVFGNGMLLSPQIRLLGAFNHQAIFLDPDPDPAVSFAERQRLFNLPRSSWQDYDQALISKGGGIWLRSEKSIILSAEVQQMLDLKRHQVTPNQLIHALLAAKVDLLWNGGIGTYVKSADELDSEVGDRANDSVRVNGNELRCKVVGEGGNLGFTQRGRVEFAASGGCINTDSVDNAAGVDCSDHEVNIKILLNRIVAQGDMTVKQRNRLLETMTDEVAELVLRNNIMQTRGISMIEGEAAALLASHRRVIEVLEQRGYLDRQLEFIPDDQQLTQRAEAGQGLLRPEIAVLLAHCKIMLKETLLEDATLFDSEMLRGELLNYFPRPLRDEHCQLIQSHRLMKEIMANQLINSLVNRMGMEFTFRMMDETGVNVRAVVYAYQLASELFDFDTLWQQIEQLDGRVTQSVQYDLVMHIRRLVNYSIFWLQRHLNQVSHDEAQLRQFKSVMEALVDNLLDWLPEEEKVIIEHDLAALTAAGVPPSLAGKSARFNTLYCLLDVVVIQQNSDCSLHDAVTLYFLLDQQLHLRWLRDQISLLPRNNYWQSLARGAMRDTFHTQCQALIEDALSTADGPSIETWLERKSDSVQRCKWLLTAMKEDGEVELEKVEVILNALSAVVG